MPKSFRDNRTRDNRDAGGRGHSTAIYFLLEHGDVSAWHRVKDAAEVWHFYAGSSLEIRVFDETEGMISAVLGVNLEAGERPQAVVPAGCWQTARSLGDWTLVGCTVPPGFDFRNSSWPRPAGSLASQSLAKRLPCPPPARSQPCGQTASTSPQAPLRQ